jgi:hypothetical protein
MQDKTVTFVVTVVESYAVEATSAKDALEQVQAIRPPTHADTSDVQVERSLSR